MKAGPDESGAEPGTLDPEHGGLHRLVLKAMAIVLLVATASLLGCLFTNEASEGDIVPPRWLVGFTTLPMVIAAHGFSDALRWLLLLRDK